jgi:hypothetical protein
VHCGVLGDRPHVQKLIGAKSEEVKEGKRNGVRPAVEMEAQKIVEPPPEPGRPEHELLDPSPISPIEIRSRSLPCQIEARTPVHLPKEEIGPVARHR